MFQSLIYWCVEALVTAVACNSDDDWWCDVVFWWHRYMSKEETTDEHVYEQVKEYKVINIYTY